MQPAPVALVIGIIAASFVSCSASDGVSPTTMAPPTVFGVEATAPGDAPEHTQAQHLYFDLTETVVLTAAQPVARFTFAATSHYASQVRASSKGAALSLALLEANGSEWTPVDDSSGVGTADIGARPNGARIYRVDVSGALAVPIRVTLSCLADCHDQCALTRQPGDVCSASSPPCDDGLFCNHVDAPCQSTESQGRCLKVPSTCEFRWAPVCGCDGTSYASSCVAANHRVSIAHDGQCEASATAL